MLDIFGTRRIAELQAARIEAGKLLMRAKEEMAYLEQERDTAREEARTLDAAVRDLSAEVTRLQTALSERDQRIDHLLEKERDRLVREEAQYTVKKPRTRGVRVKQVDGQTIAEQVE